MFKYIPVLFFMMSVPSMLNAHSLTEKIHDANILITEATKFLDEHTIPRAGHAFMRDVSWRKGDLSLSLIRDDGTVIVDVSAPDTAWEDMSDKPHFKRWLNQAAFVTRNGKSGWTVYAYKNDVRAVYVKKVKKDNMNLYLSVGFYPEDSLFETELIVNAAADYIEQVGSQQAFEAINDPSAFVSGDIVVAVIGIDGKLYAYGQADQGVKSPEEFSAEVLKASEEHDSGWLESIHNNAKHQRYYQKVFDEKTQKNYLVTAGFYSGITREKVNRIVNNAINLIKRSDESDIIQTLQENANALLYGHSAVRVFTGKGDLVFDARVPKYGKIEGEPSKLTQEILALTQQKTSGWKAVIKKSTAYLLYFQSILGYEDEEYIVTAGFYPKDKDVTIQAVVDHGAFFMEHNVPEKAFEEFSDPSSLFTLGDISLVVYTLDGICLLNNDRQELAWADLKSVTDQEGKFIVPSLQLIAKRFGSGWATFTLSNSKRHVYARRVYTARLESDTLEQPVKYTGYILAAGYFE